MRFYPFGSSSLNQIYNTTLATTASLSSYALSASYAIRITSASYATSGVPGANGSCSFTPGLTGDIGLQGIGGAAGGVSLPVGVP